MNNTYDTFIESIYGFVCSCQEIVINNIYICNIKEI